MHTILYHTSSTMDITQVYSIVIASSFGLLMFVNSFSLITRFIRYLSPLISKHLIYRQAVEQGHSLSST
jgi:hypothetical protein